MSDRNRPQEPEGLEQNGTDPGGFRGVVLDTTDVAETVAEPPSEPAQPPSPAPESQSETQ